MSTSDGCDKSVSQSPVASPDTRPGGEASRHGKPARDQRCNRIAPRSDFIVIGDLIFEISVDMTRHGLTLIKGGRED